MKLTTREIRLLKMATRGGADFEVPTDLRNAYFSLLKKRLLRYDAANFEFRVMPAGKRVAGQIRKGRPTTSS